MKPTEGKNESNYVILGWFFFSEKILIRWHIPDVYCCSSFHSCWLLNNYFRGECSSCKHWLTMFHTYTYKTFYAKFYSIWYQDTFQELCIKRLRDIHFFLQFAHYRRAAYCECKCASTIFLRLDWVFPCQWRDGLPKATSNIPRRSAYSELPVF